VRQRRHPGCRPHRRSRQRTDVIVARCAFLYLWRDQTTTVTLVWGTDCQGLGLDVFSLDIVAAVSLFDRMPFLRPDLSVRVRRAQPRSRLAVALLVPQVLLSPGHALTAASTARGLWGAGRRRAMGGGTWTLAGP